MRERVHHSPSPVARPPASAQPAPAWTEFVERPGMAIELCSPASELATVLQRSREDLDRAAQAGAESRLRGQRALAELAVLAVQLGDLLERHAARDGAPDDAQRALRRLQDRMLAHVAASGLEVMRLSGARVADIADAVDVECWRYDAGHESPVVVEELEAAVRLDGAVLRRGRVVVGGRSETPVCDASERHPRPRRGERPALRTPLDAPSAAPAALGIACPIASCGAVNDVAADTCIGCLAPLASFARLTLHPRDLFNRGLRAAREGDSSRARECFAAVVLWQPDDIGTRNAHALACLEDGDVDAARRAWREVLARSPGDPLAVRGLAALERTP